jgi:hypothetical protein
VDCSKIGRVLPSFKPSWTVATGIEELYSAYLEHGLVLSDLQGTRYLRIATIRHRLESGTLDRALRPLPDPSVAAPKTVLTRA